MKLLNKEGIRRLLKKWKPKRKRISADALVSLEKIINDIIDDAAFRSTECGRSTVLKEDVQYGNNS